MSNKGIYKSMTVAAVLATLYSCNIGFMATVDTTPPSIISVTTNPSPVIAGQDFSLNVFSSDNESNVFITLDMDEDGIFDDDRTGYYETSGRRTIAVKAESDGGFIVNFYSINVETLLLDLDIVYSAVSIVSNGEFQIDYTLCNLSNTPVMITGAGYLMYGRTYSVLYDIVETTNTLGYKTIIATNGSASASLAGYSVYDTPYYFDFVFTYSDPYGISNTESYIGGIFTVYQH